MRNSRFTLTSAVLAVAVSAAQATEVLTYVDLVKRLTDMSQLAVLPDPGETCRQWSSYDRRSTYDAGKKAYGQWSANGDGNGIIRREGDREVMAEMSGPGVIWRIWSATAGKGHVKVFLDGASSAAVDMPFHNYFDGKSEPFQGKALCHVVARGWNCYVPLPYQKSCKIVADKGWGRYYHFTYTTYPSGTVLPTFRCQLSAEEKSALVAANAFLENKCGTDPAGPRAGEKTEVADIPVAAGQTARFLDLPGPRAVSALRVRLDVPDPPDDIATLRELCLRITWDEAATPQVWCPLGDFFGSAPGRKLYRSLPLGMTDQGMYSLWYMPFAKRAVVEVSNDGKQTRTVRLEVTHAPLTTPAERLGRFHAKWHRDALLPEDAQRRAIDWTMLKTEGRGRFVGVMLHVWNPRGSWWGEGDEKFFVDGEPFPSTFGTGSEDYFGYAWCCPDRFVNAYHSQPHNDGANRGHVCVNRWHIVDNVPFQTSFEAAIEKYYRNKRPTLYAAVAYWYQAPGGRDPYGEVPLADRTGYYQGFELPTVKGAMEGERLRVVERTGGLARPQDMGSFGDGWSGFEHLWWTGGKPGDKLTVAFPVKTAGRARLLLQLTKARDYGIVQLHLNGAKLGEPFDLYNPSVVPTGVLDTGEHQLAAGRNRLTMEIVGANDKAIKAYMAGLDYVRIEPVQ